ncbi:acyl-CoA dehydrogenase family protein [[Kitasatospora] papulosa]|uniref:acyl-CoA dehydrogenase family protein n=1 Tax=[Kitasatospora] papulosa TaxID=1464011 RepID=UPI0036E7C808
MYELPRPMPEGADTTLARALGDHIFSGALPQSMRARAAVAAVVQPVRSGASFQDRARAACEQLRGVVSSLGSSSEIAGDLPLLFSLFDWSAVAAPDLFPILSGHFTLTIGAVSRLGDGGPDQLAALAELEDARRVGVFLLTELGFGSNVLELRTEARWDASRRSFTLHTPEPAAVKFMPNVADEGVPRTTVIAARLIADGRDEGVFPFLLALRDTEGALAPGVSVWRMPDKGFCPMDNAMIRFDGAVVPESSWLNGGIAAFDADGHLSSAVPELRERFHRTIEQLQTGRVALSAGTVAAARAGMWLTVHYAAERRTAGGTPMLARDNVAVPLILATARLYAATALADAARAALAEAAEDSDRLREASLLALLSKPLLSGTALSALQECRERMGAQGMFRANMITDYIGITQAVITAEGDNQVLRVAAGRALATARRVPLPDLPQNTPRAHLLLDVRAHDLIAQADPASGYESMKASEAVAISWAAGALQRLQTKLPAPASVLVEALSQLYATDQVLTHAAWYIAHGSLDAAEAASLLARRTELAHALAPHLFTLTAAFGVDAPLVPSAFVAEDYQEAWISETGWTWPHNAPAGSQTAEPRPGHAG